MMQVHKNVIFKKDAAAGFPAQTSMIGNIAEKEGNDSVSPAASEIVNIDHPDATLAAFGEEAFNMPPPGLINNNVPLALKTVSGKYRGRSTNGDLELELRVDVDGRRPMRRVSGDFYRTMGDTITYIGSFIIQTPILSVTPTQVVIDGQGMFSITTASPRLQVTIKRVGEFMSPSAAEAQFMTVEGVPGIKYTCNFQSAYFRRVEFETDFVTNVQPFSSYNTGLLPCNGPVRTLTVTAAFAEAGVEMVETGGANEVPIAMAGPDKVWTNRELHASMEKHFQLWKDEPGWKVWLLAATSHRTEDGLRGVMFDQQGAQRQGCAVFHDVIGGNTTEVIRGQLRTYVHEMGHCFNLYHSHQKEFMHPPQPNRLDALSWMHYPDYYLSPNGSGASAYWAAFPFQFDDLEIIHLRHAFRNDIIMGGNNFGTGAADVDPNLFADPILDKTGLQLKIKSEASYYCGEPVVVEFKLALTDMRGKRVNARLHPNYGYVQVGISKPGGKTIVYRPFLQQCADPEILTLDCDLPAVYDSAYIGYGKDGFYFNEPGVYELRAVYHAMDSSQVFSNILRFRVDAPADNREKEIADLFLGEAQGKLLYLLGSDADSLQKGNEAFDHVIQQYPDHPMAVYAKLIKGMNASLSFKTIDTKTKEIYTREANFYESAALLSDVFDASTALLQNPAAETGVDNITLNMAAKSLVTVQQAMGDTPKANATAQKICAYFALETKGIPKFVQDKIKREVYALLQDNKEMNTTG
ncbi:MAG: hypothetical protein JWP81_4429 [Ferruginibacter sp.]|nr:hypothetical protein [Ferruginibacter sp.]